jgi:hypothetical protein
LLRIRGAGPSHLRPFFWPSSFCPNDFFSPPRRRAGISPFVGTPSFRRFGCADGKLKWAAAEPGTDKRPTEFPEKQGEKGTTLYLALKRAK